MGKFWYRCDDVTCCRPLLFCQDVWAHMLPPSGQGPPGDGVRPRHPDPRREDRRDDHRPGEPLPVQIRSPVWPAAVLLHVSADKHLCSKANSLSLSPSHTLSFYVSRPVSSGINQWRDQLTPRQLLHRVCERRNLPKPVYQEDVVHFRGDQYTAADLGEWRGPESVCVCV